MGSWGLLWSGKILIFQFLRSTREMKAQPHGFAVLILLIWSQLLHAQWTTYAPMPTARWGAGCVEAGGRLYVISGNSSTNNEVYNPGTNSWTVLAPIPIFTAYPQMASWNGKIYVLGGANVSTWLTSNQIYDIATNTWSTGAPMPGGRMGGTAVAYNGKIYVTTGWNGVLMNSLDIYDIATNTWSTGANAPTARYQTRGGLIGGRMYVAGGYISGWIGNNESYDIATNTWSTHAAMPGPRYIHAGGSDGANLFMAAGYNGGATNTFQSYNPASNSWTIRPNAPTARYRVDGAVVNGCFYVAGGFNGVSTVATLEGFCGLVILPSPAVTLHGTLVGSQVVLDWAMDQPMEADEFQVERSQNADHGFMPIANLPVGGVARFSDPDPLVDRAAYRLTWIDHEGSTHASNVVNIGTQVEPEPVFVYSGRALRFIPVVPYPLDQGVATLMDASGRLLREERVVGQVDWSLETHSPGVYVFRWVGADGQAFTKKVIR